MNGDIFMPMRLTHAAAALCAAASLAPALAQAAPEPRYTYAEIGYVNADYDDYNSDGDGLGLGGSYALHRNVHLLLEYQDVDFDGPADASQLALGAGVNFPLRKGLDFVGRARWIDFEIDAGPHSDDDSGYGLEAGVRTMINPQLELDGSLRYVDVGDDNTSVVIGALYEFTPVFALGGDVELSNDYTAFFLKVRAYFNPPAQLR